MDGLIVVDLPPEHNEDLCHPAQAAGLDFIRLTTPTTGDQRLPTVLEGSSGFVYYVSVAGVTGANAATLEHVEEAVARLRRHTDLPIGIGFGIRSAEHAAAVARLADGVVVGSALIDRIAKARDNAQAVRMSSPCGRRRAQRTLTDPDSGIRQAQATRCAWPCVARCQNREEKFTVTFRNVLLSADSAEALNSASPK